MRVYLDLRHFKDIELLNLILRNSSDSREETLEKAVQLGLRGVVRQMKAEGKLLTDREYTITEINALLAEDKQPGYCGFGVSSISSARRSTGSKI